LIHWELDQSFLDQVLVQSQSPDGVVDSLRLREVLDHMEHALIVVRRALEKRTGVSFFKRVASLSRLSKISVVVSLLIVLAIGLFSWSFLGDRRQGLTGTYFKGENFDRIGFVRIDPTIDFSWGAKPPLPNFPRDHYSVRWIGYIYMKRAEKVEFTAASDDGVRLWVDTYNVIDNWKQQNEATTSGVIALGAGYHMVKLEYFESSGVSSLHLFWKRESDAKRKIIPRKYLYPINKFSSEIK
jgi:hypothetical protein